MLLPESYRHNVIVYRCVNLISQSAKSYSMDYNQAEERFDETLPHHALHRLLSRPNPKYAEADFFNEVIASLLLLVIHIFWAAAQKIPHPKNCIY